MMTPYELEILMHYHTSSSAFPRHHAPAFISTVNALEGMNLLQPTGEHLCFVTTARAIAYIDHILNLPLPEQKWVMPEAA